MPHAKTATPTTKEARDLAASFSAKLIVGLTAEQMILVRERNRVGHPSVCASHDFCDANEVMDEAFTLTVGREFNGESDADAALWNSAWDLAKANGFRVSLGSI